ncbi:MAG: discoidin domain-containing protein [Planctomycetota bacterium]|nr:discoidin domain-containing protein [Planctomycetota bacterium]
MTLHLPYALPAMLVCLLAVAAAGGEEAAPAKHRTDWFKDAQWGVFTHYLTGANTTAAAWNQQVEKFDVAGLGKQLEGIGCRYYVITLGQNSGHYCSPNAAYDKYVGIQPSKCSTRDIVAEIHEAISPKGIKLMLYLPCQAPNADPIAQKGLGLAQGARDQPIDEAAARKWADVIREWSSRYGAKVVGWWFDGAYGHVRFNDTIARIYAEAVRAGNPEAIVAFNPGVQIKNWSASDDYTAGEINEPLAVECDGRWLGKAQWHMLSYLGPTWCAKPPRFKDEVVVEITRGIIENEGVVTWDVPIQPSGLIPQPFVDQLTALRKGLAEPRRAEPEGPPIPLGNLAYHKRAKLLDVTGTKRLDVNSGKHFARNGVDGDPDTKAHAGGEWPWTYHVDLAKEYVIDRVVITFDKECFATQYKLNLSADGKEWITIVHMQGCKGGRQEHHFAGTKARYVRVQALKPDGPDQEGKQMGVAELEVYEGQK